MGVAVATKQHILQSINWSRFDLEGWLTQFGAWLNIYAGSSSRTVIPTGIAMINAVKTKKQKDLSVSQQLQVITDYLTGDYQAPKPRKTRTLCEIDDNEARAVQRLVLDMKGQSKNLDDWMNAIVDRYFYGNSWSEMVRENRTQADSRMSVKCGLAALHSRYGFIVY